MCWKVIILTPDQKRLSAIIVRQILCTIKDQQPTYFGIFVSDICLSLLPTKKGSSGLSRCRKQAPFTITCTPDLHLKTHGPVVEPIAGASESIKSFEHVRLPNPPVASTLCTACALLCNKAADYCGCSGTGN